MVWNKFPLNLFGFLNDYFAQPKYSPPPPPSFWSFPTSFEMKSASWNMVFNCEAVYYVILAAFVGALTSCVYHYYMNWGQQERQRTYKVNKSKHLSRPRSKSTRHPFSLQKFDHEFQQYDILQHLANHRELGMTEAQSEKDLPKKVLSMDRTPDLDLDRNISSPDISVCHARRSNVQTQSSILNVSAPAQIAQICAFKQIQIPDFFKDQFSPVLPVTFEEELIISSRNSEIKNKIVLHQFPRGKNQPCSSCHGLKVETYLRLCGIPYEISFDCSSSCTSGPWISCGDEIFAGTHDCIKFLQKMFPEKVKSHLPKILKKVPVWYMYILVDLHLPWCVSILRELIGQERKNVEKMTDEEILSLIHMDLTALTSSLAHKEFLIGDSMTDLDCSAFAILAQLVWPCDSGSGHPFKKLIKSFPTLIKYCHRIKMLLWNDFEWRDNEPHVKGQGQTESRDEIGNTQQRSGSRSATKPTKRKATENSQSAPNNAVEFTQPGGNIAHSSSDQTQGQCQGQGQLNSRMTHTSSRRSRPYTPRQEVGIFTLQQQQDRPCPPDFGL